MQINKGWPRLILTKEDRRLRSLLTNLDRTSDVLVRLITTEAFTSKCKPECAKLIVEICDKVRHIKHPVDLFGFHYVGPDYEQYFLVGTLDGGSYEAIRACCPSEDVIGVIGKMIDIDREIQMLVHGSQRQ